MPLRTTLFLLFLLSIFSRVSHIAFTSLLVVHEPLYRWCLSGSWRQENIYTFHPLSGIIATREEEIESFSTEKQEVLTHDLNAFISSRTDRIRNRIHWDYTLSLPVFCLMEREKERDRQVHITCFGLLCSSRHWQLFFILHERRTSVAIQENRIERGSPRDSEFCLFCHVQSSEYLLNGFLFIGGEIGILEVSEDVLLVSFPSLISNEANIFSPKLYFEWWWDSPLRDMEDSETRENQSESVN